MRLTILALSQAGLLVLALAACGDTATQPVESGYGPHPVLPPPKHDALPTLKFADAVGWPAGGKPVAAPGLAVSAYASGLRHPRWLYVLPNGDVLVAESEEPAPPPGVASGIKDWIAHQIMGRAGAGGASANRITLLRDADGDGVPETRTVFLQGLNSPFGMSLVGDTLYVADNDAVLRFPYHAGDTQIAAGGFKVADLPSVPTGHWTRNILASRDGSKLYVTVGSGSNAAENGMEPERNRANILELDPASGSLRVFASGLRNPNGLAWEPHSGALWTTVNERDDLGGDLVPDYMTSVKDGGFYGWPYSYYGQHIDDRVQPQDAALVAKALVPDYALGAHTASLGLSFYQAALLPPHYAGGAFVGQHGSWNRNPRSGYKVIFVPFAEGQPAGPPEDVLTGFLNAQDQAQGRPVGVAVDRSGALLVADDVGNTVWRVTPAVK